jgi:hypothetical protein
MMQITLVQSKDTFSSVLAIFETKFSLDWTEIDNNFKRKVSAAQSLMISYSIKELRDMTDFIGSTFTLNTDFPKRNSKAPLAVWVASILFDLRELADIETTACSQKRKEKMDFYKATAHLPCLNWRLLQSVRNKPASKSFSLAQPSTVIESSEPAIAAQSVENSSPDFISGLIISFGKTLDFLPRKTVTRRTWKGAHAQKFVNAFNQNKSVRAFDKDPRYGGKQIGWCRLLCAPYQERLCDMPEEDLLAEGGMCSTIGEFIQRYFDGNPRLEVWVIRFEFIADLVLASEVNPVVDVNPMTDSPSAKVEVLEPEEKPVYKISIHRDREIIQGKRSDSTEERVSALPPYLLDRQRDLFEKSSYTVPSCDASYTQVACEQLSNIAQEHGQLIELITDDLMVYKVNVHGNPPPYVVHKRSVYKRMTWGAISLGSTVKYAQVICEHLSILLW